MQFARENNWEISPVPWCQTGFFINRRDEAAAIGNTIEHAIGKIYVQEASSMIPVEALFWGHENEKFSGKMVADVAASPGSKTTHIACKMQEAGTIIANELSASRLKALYSNLERCGVCNTILTHYDGENLCQLLPETFDFLLLDAPCTGEGTVRKNYDALKNWTKEDASRMSVLQKKLITAAFGALKIGGEMVYSTCTLAREENQEVVAFLQQTFPDAVEIISLEGLFPESEKSITPEGFLHVFPEIYDSEGFFVAKIKKTKSIAEYFALPPLKKFPFTRLSPKESGHIFHLFEFQWGYQLPKMMTLWKRENEIWLFPQHIETIVCRVRSNRAGICLGEIHKNKWKTSHEAISAFGKYFSKNTKEVSAEEVIDIFAGKNLEIDEGEGAELLLTYKNASVAVGKMIHGIWKNGLPRVLVRGLEV